MKILLLGDSLFARHEGQNEPHINYSLKQLLPAIDILNLAQSGDNSYDLLAKLDCHDLSGHDVVFVWIGANDLAIHKQVFLGEFQENLIQISQKLLKLYNKEQLVFLGLAPIDENKQDYRTNRLVTYYSQVVKKTAKASGSAFISMQEAFEQSDYPLEFVLKGRLNDGLHFGSVGYALLANTICDYLSIVKKSRRLIISISDD